jgi:hypothetical protein
MRIWHLLALLAGIVLTVLLAGCGGGGGGTTPSDDVGSVTVDDTNQQVVYTPPSGREVYAVFARCQNVSSSQLVSANFHYQGSTETWVLDTSSESTQFTGTAYGTFDMRVYVVFASDTNTSLQVGSPNRLDLSVTGSGPPPPPWTN